MLYKKEGILFKVSPFLRDPGGTQTHDLQNRNLTLYSLSYQALNAGAKV